MPDLHNGLPVYRLEMTENGTGLEAIALVDVPAIGRNFLKFSKQFAFAVNEERRILSGPLMIPDQLIYRDDKMGKYYVFFSKDQIEEINLAYFKANKIHSVNLMHKPDEKVEGVVMFESFISDSSRGINPMQGFDDCPDGTWFGSFKVYNDEVWQKIQSEDFRGFSVEGLFNFMQRTEDDITEDELDALSQLLSGLEKKV